MIDMSAKSTGEVVVTVMVGRDSVMKRVIGPA